MLRYLSEYNVADMRQVMRNGRTPPHETDARLDGKLCVISGATSGVGLAAARRLHAHGADILMINRDAMRSQRVVDELTGSGPGAVDFVIADFADLSQVAAAARELQGRPVDVLINNAGVHLTTRQITVDGFELVFAVNHLSHLLLTRALLPGMVARGAGRIVQVSSQGHRFGGPRLSDLDWSRRRYMGLRGYGAAKTAQLLCTWEIADQLAGGPVTIDAMHPGAVKTNVGLNNGPLYRWFHTHVVMPGLDDVEISAVALHTLVADPELAAGSGRYFNLTHPETPAPHALDRAFGRRVWDTSLALLERFENP
jgi:NAD(P)-dependent dehydrogenase (short-subunit alcohol dehydrogenase family)